MEIRTETLQKCSFFFWKTLSGCTEMNTESFFFQVQIGLCCAEGYVLTCDLSETFTSCPSVWGSFDFRFVYIWDTTSRRILYKLPGHAGSVNEVTFHPEEPVGESSS